MLEQKDKNMRILEVLKENSKLSTGKISKRTGIPATTIFNRIKKMEKEGVIKKYTVEIDYKKIGIGIQAFVFITQDYKSVKEGREEKLLELSSKDPRIVEAFRISGRFDIVLVIRTKDIDELNEFLLNIQKEGYGIIKTETMVILQRGI